MPSFSATLFCVSAALLGVSSALPSAPSPIVPRSCKVTYPTRMTELTPYHEQPLHDLVDFCVSSNRVRYVEFGNIPANAGGACQLEFVFPPGYSVAGPGNHQVNVWKTERAIHANDTWAHAPKPITTFGTVVLNSNPTQESRIIVNSGSCDSMKYFKIGTTDSKPDSSITFTQQLPPAAVVAGLRIVHSC